METINKVSFYTEGEGFTNLLRDFIEEGKNFTVYQILRDGGFTDSLANQFIRGELKFTGTTQFGEDLSVEPDTYDAHAALRQSVRSILAKYEDEWDEKKLNGQARLKKYINDADVRILKNAFGEKTLLDLYRTDEINEYTIELITNEGYGYVAANYVNWCNKNDIHDGLILPNGDLITCGYQEHSSLYPFLRDLGLVKVSCWTDCEETIHISSRQISGAVAHAIGHRWRNIAPTEDQLQTIFHLRSILDTYGEFGGTITNKLLDDCSEVENFGGKWDNLSFIKKYYKDIQLPKFGKEPIEGVKNCLRTSPKYSLPGLLTSIFDIQEDSVSEIYKTFEKYKDVRKDNELHVFYQEFLEGANGVFHCDENGFRYDISENRGDIVQGKIGTRFISQNALRRLKDIGESFYQDFARPVQVEFVIDGDNVWIVQLRIFENNPEKTVLINKPESCLFTGKTFSKDIIEVDVNDILVIDSDGDSELLLGKKALIVKQDVEFSHILALSKALRIPSLYATGEIELPQTGQVKFNAYNSEGWVTKI